MSSAISAGGAPSTESKSAKKRKAKGETAGHASSGGTASPAPDATQTVSEHQANGVDAPGDSVYLKELNKSIRNVHKKLASSAKTDSVIAENPGKSLDDLVAAKKINADQKAQVLKKPALQAQLAQLEEQLIHYRSFGQEYEERFAREKSTLVATHQSEIAQAKEEALAEAQVTYSQKQSEDLLILSQFLHAAAAKRQSDDADSDEGRAFEGALLSVYQGNNASLTTLKNLINGTNDKVPDIQGELLDYDYAQLKNFSIQSAPPLHDSLDDDDAVEPEQESDPVPAATSSASVTGEDQKSVVAGSDPTVAHAGLTELEDAATIHATKNEPSEQSTLVGPEQSSTGAEAANAVAESNWDPQASMITNDSATGEGWVEVPRDPAETDTGLTATPAAMHGASSWAEEMTEGAAVEEKAAAENDGFEQVVHHPNRDRGRGRGRGEFRGRGPRGERGRGRGGDEFRRGGGRGRGRGEGGFRGGSRGGRGREINTTAPATTTDGGA